MSPKRSHKFPARRHKIGAFTLNLDKVLAEVNASTNVALLLQLTSQTDSPHTK